MGKECKQHAAPLRTARNIEIFLDKKNKQTNNNNKARIHGRFETNSVF